MRKPSTAAMFGIHARTGLTDYLSGKAQLSEIIYQPEGIPNLSLIPGAGEHTLGLVNPSELLASANFDSLVKSLRATGAVVLIDTPPLQVGDDVLSVAQRSDCFLLVVEEGKSTVADVEEASRLLRDHNLIGTVLNKSSEQPKRFESYYTIATDKADKEGANE
jgi:Mrp family chromosome partitioning ATPase